MGGLTQGVPDQPKNRPCTSNCLELLAATLAVKAFMKNASQTLVLLQLDNATAVAYVNNMGGTVSSQLTELAKELWLWALDKGIYLRAQHIPGISNTVADAESRTQWDRSDWMLCPPSPMTHISGNGLAGVPNEAVIPFRDPSLK